MTEVFYIEFEFFDFSLIDSQFSLFIIEIKLFLELLTCNKNQNSFDVMLILFLLIFKLLNFCISHGVILFLGIIAYFSLIEVLLHL